MPVVQFVKNDESCYTCGSLYRWTSLFQLNALFAFSLIFPLACVFRTLPSKRRRHKPYSAHLVQSFKIRRRATRIPNGDRATQAESSEDIRASDDVPESGAAVSFRTVEQLFHNTIRGTSSKLSHDFDVCSFGRYACVTCRFDYLPGMAPCHATCRVAVLCD